MISTRQLLLHLDRTREENVVLQMNMPVQVALKSSQAVIKTAITWAGVVRNYKIGGQFPDPGRQHAGVIVVGEHARYWKLDRAETRANRAMRRPSLHAIEDRKKDAFFLHHVRGEFLRQRGEGLLNRAELGMSLSVTAHDFSEQVLKPRRLLADEGMMAGDDMRCQIP